MVYFAIIITCFYWDFFMDYSLIVNCCLAFSWCYILYRLFFKEVHKVPVYFVAATFGKKISNQIIYFSYSFDPSFDTLVLTTPQNGMDDFIKYEERINNRSLQIKGSFNIYCKTKTEKMFITEHVRICLNSVYIDGYEKFMYDKSENVSCFKERRTNKNNLKKELIAKFKTDEKLQHFRIS